MSNRLASETSPYLLQHADNPVDWYPWGEEALALARTHDRPILLSIGYSACHWCHVMERESFEDPDTAQLMNELFVNIKVDREERPDVDQIYMRAVQSMTGRGGWPLTAVLTPDARPFFGGTYFPPVPRHRMPSFQDVLRATARAYRDRRAEVEATADQLTQAVERSAELASEEPRLEPDMLEDAVERIAGSYDSTHGGFGSAPKFPQPVVLDLLLAHHARTQDPDALDMVVTTLDKMARGGLNDQLAGGFHRYSVDAEWLVPHFEKMLYDNALLARVYVDAWRHTGRQDLKRVAEATLDWMIADLGDPAGGFHSAWDADSEGEEGRYYVWSLDEVRELLGENADTFARVYDVSAAGNFEGSNILHRPRSIETDTATLGLDAEALEAVLTRGREILLAARRHRVEPGRDTKVLASWNGMAVRALAEAGAAFEAPRFLEAASRCARFMLDALRVDGSLMRVWDGRRARIPGFLEDHAGFGLGLLALHGAALDASLLGEVEWCAEEVLSRFWDDTRGVFYDTPSDGERLIVRPREVQDSATPSGGALAAELVLQAGRLFGRQAWVDVAERALANVAPLASQYPLGFGRLLAVVDLAANPALEVTLVGDPAEADMRALAREAWRRALPGRLLVAATPQMAGARTEGRAGSATGASAVPLLRDRPGVEGRATAYVCQNHTCSLPVTDPAELGRLLDAARMG